MKNFPQHFLRTDPSTPGTKYQASRFEVTVIAISILLIVLAVSGCSLFVPATEAVLISASDHEAKISVDGQYIGKGSVSVDLTRNRSHLIVGNLDGRSVSVTIGRRISGTGIADIIGGFILVFPFLGALSPGFWTLDKSMVNLAIPVAAQ